MTISNLKDLKKLIKLLRETGVHTATVDGISLQLGSLPQKPRQIESIDPMSNINVPVPNIPMNPVEAAKVHAAKELAKLQDYIETDEPTEEQLMNWSVRPEAGHEQ